ncbi:MAG TPA: hypothetical protein VE955_03515 [Candidatus Dormibacteraeota bacterium]|nr:hypothetical protein [Candidatus Dormibacteraeota bacterium]
MGKEVLGAEGWKIGRVKEIPIDKDTLAITSLSLDLESSITKEFNLKKMWGKPISQSRWVRFRESQTESC